MDNLTKEQRKKNMQSIKSKDTSIELMLRRALWNESIRYRKNYGSIPGRPDIALTKYKIAIFCDSEFWHGFDWENKNAQIKSNREYWIPKIEGNMIRDKKVNQNLKEEGWLVLRFWEREIRKNLSKCIDEVNMSILNRTKLAEKSPHNC